MKENTSNKQSRTGRAMSDFRAWLNVRHARKIFVAAAAFALVFIIISRFDPSGISMYVALGLMVVGLLASIGDSWQTAKDFEIQVKQVEENHKQREIDLYGEVISPCFDIRDRKEIKSRRRRNWGFIILKLIFIAILIGLLFR